MHRARLTGAAFCSNIEQVSKLESLSSPWLSIRRRICTKLQARLTVSEAAEASATSRASARRCLLTLTELGYLEFDGKYFRPQPRLLALSAAYSGTRSLPQVAQPFLKAARDELHESISLAVLDRDAALFVARSEAERLVTTGISIGIRIDLYCSATGRVLLSAWADERLLAYLDRVSIEARTRYSLVKKT